MAHHTKECKLGQTRLIKKFVWFALARGYMIFFEDIIVEQRYEENLNKNIHGEIVASYHWKDTKRWTIEQFEEKHGEFDKSKVKDRKRRWV